MITLVGVILERQETDSYFNKSVFMTNGHSDGYTVPIKNEIKGAFHLPGQNGPTVSLENRQNQYNLFDCYMDLGKSRSRHSDQKPDGVTGV